MPELTRRALLDTLLWTSLAATTFACAAPIPFYLIPPEGSRGRSRVVAGRRSDLPVGTARKFMLGAVPAVVLNDGTFRAFDARCTHQGCVVNWEAASKKLVCPCHGAIFGSDGAPLTGPAKRPLVSLAVHLDAGGDVVVSD